MKIQKPQTINPVMQADYPSNVSRYVPALTGIRALAALLVLGLHTEQNVPVGLDAIMPFFARGYLGVDFFFLLSGFIITHVYLANLACPNRIAVKVFFWHRFIRIYPVHLTILAGLIAIVSLASVTGIALNNPVDWQWKDLIWHLTLLQAWGVTATASWNAPSWSISAEWFAYLLFPLLAPALIRVHNRMIALVISVAALAAMALTFSMADWTLNTWGGAPALTRVCAEFICGAALCRAVTLGLGNKLSRLGGDMFGTAAFIAFLFGASAGLSDFALVALLALTITAAATSGGYFFGVLGSRPLVWLGEVSYSVYMIHFPILILIRRLWERLGFSTWAQCGKAFAFIVTVTLVIALAAALFYLVERPARTRLRDQLGVFAPADIA